MSKFLSTAAGIDRPDVICEFPYRQSKAILAFLSTISAFMLLVFLILLADDGPVHFRGHEVEGASAVFVKILGLATGVSLSVATARLLWIRWRYPNQRIAFTADGILLPPNRWTTTEAFVPFGHITGCCLDYEYGAPSFLKFYTCSQEFSISQQKLPEEAFHEICSRLEFGILHAMDPCASSALDGERAETENSIMGVDLLLSEKQRLCYYRTLMTFFCSGVGFIFAVVVFFAVIDPDVRKNWEGISVLGGLTSLLLFLFLWVRRIVRIELNRIEQRLGSV